MVEIFGLALTWKMALGGAVALLAAIKAKRLHNAIKEWRDVYNAVESARSESSPNGRNWSQGEVEKLVEQSFQAVKATAPLVMKLLRR